MYQTSGPCIGKQASKVGGEYQPPSWERGGDEEWGRITSKERKIKEENKGEKNRG
jgi:hypothetical protein